MRIASRSAGFGYGMTWHSPFCSLAQRTEASGVIANTRSSILALPPQYCGKALKRMIASFWYCTR
ncbi:hypothetical protein D3C78_1824490 [compost metagenome]